MKLIITGPPGAGKGTISRFIKDKYGIPILSTGEMLREEIKKGSELGKIAKDIMDKGDLVTDDIVIDIIRSFTQNIKTGYLLDGFPRNLNQAIKFDGMLRETNSKIDRVINVEVDENILIERIRGRVVCPKCSRPYHVKYAKPIVDGICDNCQVKLEVRSDDSEENARRRLLVYHNNTKPLINYYIQKNILIEIRNDTEGVEETYKKLTTILDEL